MVTAFEEALALLRSKLWFLSLDNLPERVSDALWLPAKTHECTMRFGTRYRGGPLIVSDTVGREY